MIETMQKISLLVVDDHAMFREGLERVIEKEPDFKIVGQYASSKDALASLVGSGASMVLLDVDLGAERALDFVVAARRAGFEGQILIVTAGMSDQEAVHLIQAGVAGIVHKQNSFTVLCDAIRQVSKGEVYLEKAYIGPLVRSVDRTRTSSRPTLTERDRTVLQFVLQGLTNRDIADRIQISEGAVKSSLRQLFHKLAVRTRAQLVKVALEQYRDQL